jgi:hypothetical protein
VLSFVGFAIASLSRSKTILSIGSRIDLSTSEPLTFFCEPPIRQSAMQVYLAKTRSVYKVKRGACRLSAHPSLEEVHIAFTLPSCPRPILSSNSTLSVTISGLETASMPRTMMAPVR